MVMSETMEKSNAPSPWLGWLEGVSIAGAVGGIGGAIATGQTAILLTALPLSLAAALNFAQRQRMQSTVHAALARHDQRFYEVKQTADALEGTDRILMIQLNNANNRIEELSDPLVKLQVQIDELKGQTAVIAQKQAELMESTLEESYYRRGLELEKRGEFKDAIAAYTEALRVNPNYPNAYMQLGAAYARAGQKQQAIAHLRTATKLFFESGDLEAYHTARELSETIHAGDVKAEPVVRVNQPEPAVESEKRLAVDELFV
jgi:tetratricopeptide (TPR) repeat protein